MLYVRSKRMMYPFALFIFVSLFVAKNIIVPLMKISKLPIKVVHFRAKDYKYQFRFLKTVSHFYITFYFPRTVVFMES